jgi:hypothetical protein
MRVGDGDVWEDELEFLKRLLLCMHCWRMLGFELFLKNITCFVTKACLESAGLVFEI